MRIPIRVKNSRYEEGDEVWVDVGGGRQKYWIKEVDGRDLLCVNMTTGQKVWLTEDDVKPA